MPYTESITLSAASIAELRSHASQYGSDIVAIVESNLVSNPYDNIPSGCSFEGQLPDGYPIEDSNYVALGTLTYRGPTLYTDPATYEAAKLARSKRAITALADAWTTGVDMSNARWDVNTWDQSAFWRIPRDSAHLEQDWGYEGEWYDGKLSVQTDDTPRLRDGYSPNFVAHAPECGNSGYLLYTSTSRINFQTYDMRGYNQKGFLKTYQAAGAISEKIIKTHSNDAIVEATHIAPYGADALVWGTDIVPYRAESRLEANPIKTYSGDGIVALDVTKTYSAGAYAEKMLRKIYYMRGAVQDLDVAAYQMSGWLVSDEFPELVMPQAFRTVFPYASECGVPHDSRNEV